MNNLKSLKKELKKAANPIKAKILQRFFKTGKGEYGEGDIFLGITVPMLRLIASKYKDLTLKEVEELLKSKIHEERLVALLLLVYKYQKGSKNEREEIYNFYLKNTKYINNWDLVDLSAHLIVGEYVFRSVIASEAKQSQKKGIDTLEKLARSKNLWERRIAIVATYYFIRNRKFDPTFKVSKILLHDKHDLIHKAVGWMLREVGKKDQKKEEIFLKQHYKTMPRTSLRYAIERFPDTLRLSYLRGNH